MRSKTAAATLLVLLLLGAGGATRAVQAATQQDANYQPQISDGVLDAVVTILIEDDGQAYPVGTGLFVRGDGMILTAYHLVKDARAVTVRLRSGETFDKATLIAMDERRNIAILHIPAATPSYSLPIVRAEEALVGSRVWLVSNTTGETGLAPAGVISSVTLADEIPGAGQGYRALKFTLPVPAGAAGGVLVGERGFVVGVLLAQPQAQVQNYAMPISSVVGMVRAVGSHLGPQWPVTARVSPTPFPIPQNTVSVPQRPVTPLAAKGPGSVVVKPARPVDVLLASKTIYVASRTTFFKPDQLINELKKKPELDAWGLSFVEELDVADLLLTIDHVLFTWKFTFKLSHQRTGVVVATGSRIIWDGNLGAPYMAERVLEKLTQVRAQQPTPAAVQADDKKEKK